MDCILPLGSPTYSMVEARAGEINLAALSRAERIAFHPLRETPSRGGPMQFLSPRGPHRGALSAASRRTVSILAQLIPRKSNYSRPAWRPSASAQRALL